MRGISAASVGVSELFNGVVGDVVEQRFTRGDLYAAAWSAEQQRVDAAAGAVLLLQDVGDSQGVDRALPTAEQRAGCTVRIVLPRAEIDPGGVLEAFGARERDPDAQPVSGAFRQGGLLLEHVVAESRLLISRR